MKFFLKPHQKPRYLRFQYKPRFWDPEKERVEAIKERIRARQEGEANPTEVDQEALKERLRSGLRKGRPTSKFDRKSMVRQESRKSNFRLLIILIALLWLTYKLLVVYL